MRKLAGMRVTAGFSQEDVAKSLGITQGAVSQWERGIGKPMLDKTQQLADLYGVTVQEIVEACMSAAHTPSVNGKGATDHDGTSREHLQNMQE